MEKALSAYGRLGIPVVLLGHTPTSVPNFLDCLHGDSDISRCSGFIDSAAMADVATEQRLGLLHGLVFIDTTPWFCVELTCPPVIDGAPVFTDGNHISAEIAPKLIPLMRSSLNEVGVLN